jgi:hypothetical protein
MHTVRYNFHYHLRLWTYWMGYMRVISSGAKATCHSWGRWWRGRKRRRLFYVVRGFQTSFLVLWAIFTLWFRSRGMIRALTLLCWSAPRSLLFHVDLCWHSRMITFVRSSFDWRGPRFCTETIFLMIRIQRLASSFW